LLHYHHAMIRRRSEKRRLAPLVRLRFWNHCFELLL
jgi:hypothetical protein